MPGRKGKRGKKRGRSAPPRGGAGRSKSLSPGSAGPSTTVTSSTGGFPSRMRVKLVYSQYNPESASASVVSQIFRGNSVYDPDQTGTGGQPYNFDDFAIEYKRYRVRACTIHVEFVCHTAGGRGATVVVVPTNSSTAFTSVYDAMAAPHAKSALLTGLGNGTKTRVTMRRTTKQVLGEDWGDRFEALVTADPADPWYYQILVFSNDASTTLGVTVLAKLTYDVEFFDRNILTLDFLRKFVADRDAKHDAGPGCIKNGTPPGPGSSSSAVCAGSTRESKEPDGQFIVGQLPLAAPAPRAAVPSPTPPTPPGLCSGVSGGSLLGSGGAQWMLVRPP